MTHHDYKLLQKIFRELESQLSQLLDVSSQHHDLHHRNPSVDVVNFEQRLAFFKTLLQAEMTYHHEPTDEPDHLIHMCNKLKQLEATYRDSTNDDREVQNDDELNLQSKNQVTTSSFYTSTTFDPELLSVEDNNDNNKLMMVKFDGGSLVDHHEKRSVEVEHLIGESENEGDDDDDRFDVMEMERRRRRRNSIGGVSGALACGMVLGMALMGFAMLAFSGCPFHFQYGHTHHYANFITPT
ncbi:hypothetical protein CsatB_009121 [Cannabis sativa]